MPRNQDEENKKHGDTLEALIDSTGPGKRGKSGEGNSPTEVQDDDDEDVENDDVEDRPDVPSTD
jgi:hypothetical protein